MDVHGGRFPFEVRVGGQDDLLHVAALEAFQQGADLELLGTDAVHGGDDAVEHVVQPRVGARPLQRHHVEGLLDDAYAGAVPVGTAAEGARIGLGDVVAPGAEDDTVLDGEYGTSEPECVVPWACARGGT